MEQFGRAREMGVTTVLLQGGLNKAIPFEYYLDLVRDDAVALSRHPCAFLLRARSDEDDRSVGPIARAGDRAPLRRRPALDSRRRSGDPDRPREAGDLEAVAEGDHEGLGRRASRGASRRYAIDRDHDVRPYRVRRRHHRTPRCRAGFARRDGRIHRLHSVELQARPESARASRDERSGAESIPAHHRGVAHLSRQFHARAGVVVFGREEDRCGRATFRRRRFRRHHLRRERDARSRLL